MPVLHLGVLDIPYPERQPAPRAVAKRRPRGGVRWRPPTRGSTAGKTTGDIAEIIEGRYGIFSMFTLLHGADIEEKLAEVYEAKLERLLLGGPAAAASAEFDTGDFAGEVSVLEGIFKKALDDQEFNGRGPGIPTRAAQHGVNHRLARPSVRGNPARPSFIDTGLLQSSLKIWVD